MESNDFKKISKKFIILSIIVLCITFILGLIFVFNIDSDFALTKTIFGEMSKIDGNNPGSGEYLLLLLFTGGLTFFLDLGILLLIILAFLVIPVGANGLLLIINIIARLFQIGVNKKWKNVTTKVLLYISTILQGILSLYLLFLSFTGLDFVYIAVYLMLAINVYAFIRNIINLKNIKNNL